MSLFVDTDIKFPVPFIDLPSTISSIDIDSAYSYFLKATSTKFCTPDYTRSDHFDGSIWLRFVNKCMYPELDTDENWGNFFKDFLKIEETPEHRKFYKDAVAFYKPYVFTLMDTLEAYTGKKHCAHGIEINMMPAHSSIKAHTDNHPYDIQTHRVHLVLSTNNDSYMICNGERRHYDKGQCFIFNNKMRHSVHNDGDTPRTHLVIDFLQFK